MGQMAKHFSSTPGKEMSYIGGKARGSKHILAVLNDERFDGMDYLEPFVGMGHVLRRVVNKRSYAASDGNALVVRLLAHCVIQCVVSVRVQCSTQLQLRCWIAAAKLQLAMRHPHLPVGRHQRSHRRPRPRRRDHVEAGPRRHACRWRRRFQGGGLIRRAMHVVAKNAGT